MTSLGVGTSCAAGKKGKKVRWFRLFFVRHAVLVLFDRGRYVVMYPRSTLSLRRYLAPLQNAEVENAAKFGGFAPQDRGN